MYRKHFALTQHPFGPEIAPEDLFASAASRELDIRLAHLLDLRGMSTKSVNISMRRALTKCVLRIRSCRPAPKASAPLGSTQALFQDAQDRVVTHRHAEAAHETFAAAAVGLP